MPASNARQPPTSILPARQRHDSPRQRDGAAAMPAVQTGGQRCSERLNIILPHPPLLICGVIQVPRFRLRRYRRCGVRTQQLMSKMLDGRGIRQHMMVNARQNGLLRLSPHQQHKARKLPFRHRVCCANARFLLSSSDQEILSTSSANCSGARKRASYRYQSTDATGADAVKVLQRVPQPRDIHLRQSNEQGYRIGVRQAVDVALQIHALLN